MPRNDQRKRGVLRTQAGHSTKPVSGCKIRSTENRHERGWRKNGLRHDVLQDQLLQLWSATKKTIIFITHDLVEAITLADRVVLMSSRPGRIKLIEPIGIARPRDVFRIHESPEFRAAHEKLWRELRPEVQLAQA